MLRCPELLLSSLLVLKWSLMLPIDLGTWNFSCTERKYSQDESWYEIDQRQLVFIIFEFWRGDWSWILLRLVLNTFISLGSCRLDYSFVLLTTAHSWKYSWELERSFAVFQEEHGQNWRSWPTSCTNFNVAGNLSTVVLSCKNVCRQLKFSKLGSTSSFFFFSRTNSAIHTTNKKLVNQYVQHDFWEQKFSVSVF